MRVRYALFVLLAPIAFPGCTLSGRHAIDAGPNDYSVNLGGQRSPGTKLYRFSTDYLSYAPDGSLISKEQTVVELAIEVDETGRQTLTNHKFELIDAEGSRHSLPGLAGWQNVMDLEADVLLGVPHSDFVGLRTDAGEPLAPEISHRVYNTFVDFYTFNNVFAQPSSGEGKDISDLTSVGEIIEHYSAYSRPEVTLGDVVAEGSYFQNGRVTLEWKGMSRVGGNPCALVGFDSGESEFRMLMNPAPGFAVTVDGGSQYWGDLYINTDDSWLEKGNFLEVVLARVEMGDNAPAESVIKRIGYIEALD